MNNSNEKHSIASILAIIIIFGSFACFLLVPTKVFENAREKEQSQIVAWLGDESDQWVIGVIIDGLIALNEETHKLISNEQQTGNNAIDRWLADRIYAGSVWVHVIMYRLGLTFLWGLFALPFMCAAFVDGKYQREISKTSFEQTSPIMHKSGKDAAILTITALFLWIFVPIFITIWVVPIAIICLSSSWWIWTVNLQKRL